MQKLLIITFSFFFIGNAFGQKKIIYNDSNFKYSLFINPVIEDQSDTSSEATYCTLSKIEICKPRDGALLQVLYPKDCFFYCSSDSSIFKMIDANFDGNNDLQIFQVKGTAGVLYYFWIYNTETKTFEQNPVLGNITSPEFDLKNKIIYSSSRLHPGERVDKYKYVNKKTVLFESTENAIRTDKNGNRLFVTTIRKRINGKMQITSKIINPD